MEITYLGQSSFKLKGKNATVVCDPFNPEMVGLKFPKNIEADIVTVSHNHKDHNFINGVGGSPMVLVNPGEYEIKGIDITGVSTFHDKSQGGERGANVVFKFVVDGITIVHLGDLGHNIDDETVEKIGDVDILFVPIGGTFTVDDKQAWNVINKIKPKIIVPMHYKIGGLSLPIAGLDPFLAQAKQKVIHVGNEIDIEKEDLPAGSEIWTFTL